MLDKLFISLGKFSILFGKFSILLGKFFYVVSENVEKNFFRLAENFKSHVPRKIFDAENNLRVVRPKSAEADDDLACVVAVNFLLRAVDEHAINFERNKFFVGVEAQNFYRAF